MTRTSNRQFTASSRLVARFRCLDPRADAQGEVIASEAGDFSAYPAFVTRAEGAHLWDVDGNRHIDYLLGYGTVILGHGDRRVVRAVVEQLERAVSHAPFWSPVQLQLLELAVEVLPHAEMAFILKTGSDATSCAVRLARIFTGRSRVLRWGYNGWHDWSCPRSPGIPAGVRELTQEFPYHQLATLDAMLRESGDVACVMMMPYEHDLPAADYLREVRRLAHAHGALFLLDEVRSGFRIALGGAQQYFDVQADLAAYSKAMANGFPVSMVAGRADLLRCLSQTKISSSFFANPADQAAALETISILRSTDALERIATHGTLLQSGLAATLRELGVAADVVGHPTTPFIRFRPDWRGADSERARMSFYRECARRGVLLHPDHQWFISAAHTAEDIAETVGVCDESLRAALAG